MSDTMQLRKRAAKLRPMSTGVRNMTLSLSLAAMLLAGCVTPVVVPKSAEDERCKMVTREMTLDRVEGVLPYCHNEDCAVAAVMLLGTAVVSGSIVVINNSVHWLEKQGKCPESDVSKRAEASAD